MAWFKRQEEKIAEVIPIEERTVKTEGIFVKCENGDCGATIYRKDLKANLMVCPQCNFHMRISARERLQMLFDDSSYQELFPNRLALAIAPHHEDDLRMSRLFAAIGRKRRIPLVAAAHAHYREPQDRLQYDILSSMRTLTLLTQSHPGKRPAGNYHLHSPEELLKFNLQANTLLFGLLKSQGEAFSHLASETLASALEQIRHSQH